MTSTPMTSTITSASPYNAQIRQFPMPSRIASLPVSKNGFPVPYFVEKVDGEYDLRVMSRPKLYSCFHQKKCWTCGQPLGRHRALVLGPMSIINRIVSEPPSHLDCACYAAQVCPFLANPRMRRNEKDMPDGKVEPPGHHSNRNPGMVAVWVADDIRLERVPGGDLFTFGDPTSLLWFTQGRAASREEILAAFANAVPFLEAVAKDDGPAGMKELDRLVTRARALLPA